MNSSNPTEQSPQPPPPQPPPPKPPPPGAVILGLWPIAGVTTVGVTDRDAESTIAAAIDSGIHTFDTAYSYGLEGQSDRYLGRAIRGNEERFHVIGKVGQRYRGDSTRYVDASPRTLRADAEASLKRIGIERFGTLMLHSVDEAVEIERSGEALGRIRDDGLAMRIGLCNATASQRARFESVCRCAAIQCPLNILQRDNLDGVIADAASHRTDVLVYWTLMKGLLAGKISRDHVFPPGDSRPGYAIFQGQARQRAHRVVDGLRSIAQRVERPVADLAVSWAVSQPGVTSALVGARRPEQILEVSQARPLPGEVVNEIEGIIRSAGGAAAT